MERIFDYHNGLGGYHALQRARRAGLAYEVCLVDGGIAQSEHTF